MSSQLSQDLKFFNWNKLFFFGGGGGILATFIFLMSETSVLLGPFNRDKTNSGPT